MWLDLGVERVSIISSKLEREGWNTSPITDAGLMIHGVAAHTGVLPKAFECASAVGAGSVWICTGPLGSRTWEEAADDLCTTLAPLVGLAQEHGVALAIEPTNSLRCDVSFISTMRDTFDLARLAGTGVVLDFAMCWYERGLAKSVSTNIDLVNLVQVNDFKLGTFMTPDRSVVGDGDIPLERLIAMLLEAGYAGVFDLEILGPKIETEGYLPAIQRSVNNLNDILGRLGA
jgi:sugar phosphate isomerase/epimerase